MGEGVMLEYYYCIAIKILNIYEILCKINKINYYQKGT